MVVVGVVEEVDEEENEVVLCSWISGSNSRDCSGETTANRASA